MATTPRTSRLALRATPQQESVLRRAAELTNKSVPDFILESAYQTAQQTLLDQRLFLITGDEATALTALLDRPGQDNSGLVDLFSRRAPWDA